MDKKTLAALSLTLLSMPAWGNTCPTHLIKEYDGHWVSHEMPGWRSAEQTDHKTTINVRDFGGAIYSPNQKRLVCVYRSSKGYWVAMVSHTHKGFKIDKHALDDLKRQRAWRWDKKHKDYACGRPHVTTRAQCRFKLYG